MTKSHLFTLNSQLFSKELFTLNSQLFTKILLFTLLASLFTLLTACGTMRQVEIVEHATHDTLYLNKVIYDSIYIDQWRSQEYHPSTLHSSPSTLHLVDTIYVEKVRLEYKYKFLKDTVRVVQIDSIPVIKTVEVVKTERYTPAIYKWSLGICIALIILIILYVVWKIKF